MVLNEAMKYVLLIISYQIYANEIHCLPYELDYKFDRII